MTHEKILASLRSELNEQTAQMRWSELERFFASGTVISIAPELDLIDVGARIAADDKQSVQRWMISRACSAGWMPVYCTRPVMIKRPIGR